MSNTWIRRNTISGRAAFSRHKGDDFPDLKWLATEGRKDCADVFDKNSRITELDGHLLENVLYWMGKTRSVRFVSLREVPNRDGESASDGTFA